MINKLRQHIHFLPKGNIDSWQDIAGVLALIVAISISLLDHGSSWRLMLSVLLTSLYVLITWFMETDDLLWLRNGKIAILAAIPSTLIFLGIGGWAAILMFFVLSATVMYNVPPRVGYTWICVFGLIVVFIYATVWSDIGSMLTGLGTFAGFMFFGSATESQLKAIEASKESQRLLDELQKAHRQLQEQASQAEELAATNERNRLAREVHDTLGHQLTVAAVQLEGAQKLIQRDPKRAEEMVSTVRGQVLGGLQELRKTVATLRAPIEETLSLQSSLARLADEFKQATHIHVALQLPEHFPDLPSTYRQTLYRAVQESLTNIQKHAEAEHVQIRLDIGEADDQQSALQMSIKDDGKGLANGDTATSPKAGFGLRGMSERVSQLNGTMSLRNGKSGGTEVRITLPLSQPQQSDFDPVHIEPDHTEPVHTEPIL